MQFLAAAAIIRSTNQNSRRLRQDSDSDSAHFLGPFHYLTGNYTTFKDFEYETIVLYFSGKKARLKSRPFVSFNALHFDLTHLKCGGF